MKKGEKGIMILAPCNFRASLEREKIDPLTGQTLLGPDGNPLTEKVKIAPNRFKIAHVFDLSQTEGRELPQIGVSELTGDVADYIPAPAEAGASVVSGPGEETKTSKTKVRLSRMETTSNIPERMREIELFGVPALFTENQIPPDGIYPGMSLYELQNDDGRFMGSVLTPVPIPVLENGPRQLEPGDLVMDTGAGYLNDYLCSLMSYDRKAIAGISRVFTQHSGEIAGACGDYAHNFKFLCGAAGIPCITISTASHSWNLVYADGQWLHVDVSANDLYRQDYILLTRTVSGRTDTAPAATEFLKELLVPGSTK